MKDKKASRRKAAKKRKILIAVAFVLVALVCGLNYFTSKYLYNGKIAQNVFIDEVEVSNLTKKEAIDILNAKYPKKDLVLNYSDKTFTIKPDDVDLTYNTEQVVEKAYNLTRENFYLKDVFCYINAKFGGADYTIKPSYNEEKIEKIVEDISKDVNQDVKNASIRVSSGIQVTPSKDGLKCDNGANKKDIMKSYDEKSYENIALNVDVTEPEIKTSDLESIDSLLGAFSTTFNAGLYERTYNISLALSRCSGQIIMPGETFSYNDSTGPRSLRNGFKNASMIFMGEYQDAPGGGVCQGSTTLFNAALLSGLEITDVQNHSKTAAYVPRGRDAMVNDTGSDFQFTNQYEHPVYIVAYVKGNTANAAIYGCKADKGKISISTKYFAYSGRPGATTYRTVTKDGKSETTKIYTAVYQE